MTWASLFAEMCNSVFRYLKDTILLYLSLCNNSHLFTYLFSCGRLLKSFSSHSSHLCGGYDVVFLSSARNYAFYIEKGEMTIVWRS